MNDSEGKINMLGMLDMKGNECIRRVYGVDGIAPTLTTSQGGHRQPKILVEAGQNMILDLSQWKREGEPRVYPDYAPTLAARDYKEPRLTTGGKGMKVLKVNDLFCGAGGMGLGFKQAGFEIAGAWDYDKFAVQSYAHNVGEHVKEADVTQMKWNDLPYAEVWSMGFPCQDLSIAGRKAGMIKGKTRSGLFFEVMRLLEETEENAPEQLPLMILAENVKGLKPYLPVLEEEFNERGYKLYLSDQNNGVFNSKFWGVPQNRERYWICGVHESIEKEFTFPVQQEDYVPRLSTILESLVDEKYYISPDKTKTIIEQAKRKIELRKELVLKVKEATKQGYAEATVGDAINIAHPNSKTRRGRVGKQVAQTVITNCEQAVIDIDEIDYRIRKLTPTEYKRLQAFPEDYEIIVSDSQAYKQFGNAVTVSLARAVAERIRVFLLSL